jgi:hypothetical protein
MYRVVVLDCNYDVEPLKMNPMEKLIVIGLAAMISFYIFSGDKPWVTTTPRQELTPPCIDKPWVTPPPVPPVKVTPGID